jgi:c-di-GMP-binding flagellar brake protein YcgR
LYLVFGQLTVKTGVWCLLIWEPRPPIFDPPCKRQNGKVRLMNLKSLLLSSDEKIVRVLRRTLGDLEIGVEHCTSPDIALRHLTRDRFEAIIVDCGGPGAESVLSSARNAPCNKRSVAVAILDPGIRLRSAFDIGAHFILYKPVSPERARSSFRAARALMKKERRRNSRVAVRIGVEMSNRESGARLKVTTTDLGEGGLAVILPRRTRPQGRWQLSLTLPGTGSALEMPAEFAWQGTGNQVGLRFIGVSPAAERQLREWLISNSPDTEKDDPPVRCQLTDLSLGGCYLEIASPFPVSTRVTLSMSAAGVDVKTEGVVRVMHPDQGMGVEFTKRTREHQTLLEKFLSVLTQNRELSPELLVEPEGLETEISASDMKGDAPVDDALLVLFRSQATLPPEEFLAELRKQRSAAAAAGVSA